MDSSKDAGTKEWAKSFACSFSTKLYHEIISMLLIKYIMLLLIFDVNHFKTLFALSYIPAAVGLVKVDPVCGKLFQAVRTCLSLSFFLHYQLDLNIS